MSARPEPAMTIGALSRRTGVPVKTLRTYEDLGLVYTVGRSAGNYRLFGEEALWCVAVVGVLRELGLTLAEIKDVTEAHLHDAGERQGTHLAWLLDVVRARTEREMSRLRERLARIDQFEDDYADELAGRADFRDQDPRFRSDS